MLSWASAQATASADACDRARYAGKRLLVVGTGSAKRGPVFERVRSLGLAEVVCVERAPNWAAPFVDRWLAADPTDPDGAARAAVAADGPFDGVVTFDEFSVVLAAALAEDLGLPGVARSVAATVRDKAAFRAFCAGRGLPAPGFLRLPREGAVEAVRAAGLGYPLIFKPTSGGGSALVRLVRSDAELVAAVAAHEAYQPAYAAWGCRDAFVESYLEGAEVDVDMLVQDGEVRYDEVSDNFGTAAPYFLETGGCFPSGLPAATQDGLRAMARDVVRALGIRHGCLHFEAKATPAGPVPIELNLRLGGAEVFAFHRAARGVDLVVEAVNVALGLPVAIADSPATCYLASTNFVPERAGTLRYVDVSPAVWHAPGLTEIVVFGRPGDPVAAPPEAYTYLGWLVAAGASPREARLEAEALTRGVTFGIG